MTDKKGYKKNWACITAGPILILTNKQFDMKKTTNLKQN